MEKSFVRALTPFVAEVLSFEDEARSKPVSFLESRGFSFSSPDAIVADKMLRQKARVPYVYVWRIADEVIYIGKGRGNRYCQRLGDVAEIFPDVYVAVKPYETDQEALVAEAFYIHLIDPRINKKSPMEEYYGGCASLLDVVLFIGRAKAASKIEKLCPCETGEKCKYCDLIEPIGLVAPLIHLFGPNGAMFHNKEKYKYYKEINGFCIIGNRRINDLLGCGGLLEFSEYQRMFVKRVCWALLADLRQRIGRAVASEKTLGQ